MNSLRIFFLLGSILLPAILLAQQPKSKTLEPATLFIEDRTRIDLFLPVLEGIAKNSREVLEQQNIKPHMMPVRQAPNESAALSYALASCLEYYLNLEKNYKLNLSPDFIWLNLGKKAGQLSTEEAMRFLAEDGTISAAILPFGSSELTTACFATPRYTIDQYLWMFREMTNPRQKVYETRKALIRGNPVLIQLKADASLKDLAAGEPLTIRERGDQTFTMVVVGFDHERELFELKGFWGRKWANSGYAWISYRDFGKAAANGYVLVPATLQN